VAESETAVAAAPGFARLSRDSLIYALGSVASKVIGIALLPLLTRVLTPEEYGRFEVVSALGGTAISVLLLGMDVAVVRLALDPARTGDQQRRLVGAWVMIEAILVVPGAAALVVAGPAISAILFGPHAPAGSVQLVGLILLAGVPQYIALTVLRMDRRPLASAAVTVATLASYALLAIGLLAWWMRDERSALLAYGVGLLLGALVGVSLLGRGVLAWPRRESVKALLVLGLPLLPAIAATTIAELANRTILLGSASATEVGYLGVGMRFASVVGLLVGGFQLAWQPHAFALGKGPAALNRIALDARRILVIISLVVVLISFIAPEVVPLVTGPTFEAALPTVGVALVGALATGAYVVASMPSAVAARTRDLGISGIAGVVAAVALNFVLAPRFGASGTAGAIATGQAIGAVTVWRLGTPHVRIPLERPTLGVMVLAAAVALVSTATSDLPLLVRATLAGLFFAVGWAEGTVRDIAGYAVRVRL
jgi:O-antigen/teichoic acid export membrane protein